MILYLYGEDVCHPPPKKCSNIIFLFGSNRLYNWKQHFVVVKSSWILEVLRQRCPLADVDFKCHLLSPHLPALSMVEHTGASSVVQTSSIHPRDETMVGKDTSIALVGTSTKNHQSNAMTAVRTGIDEHTGISSVCFPDNHCGNMATSSTSFEQTSHFSSTSKAAAPVSQVQFLSSFLSEKRTGNKTASIALVGQIGLASGCNGPETNSVLMTSRTTPVKQMGLSSGNNLVTTTSSTIPVDLVGVVTSGNEIENSSVITTANTAPVNQPGRFFGNASENNNSNNTTTSIIAAGHDQVATIIPRNHSNAATTLMTSSTEIHGLSSAGAEATSSSSIQARYDSIWQKLEEERAATPFESE